MAQRFYVYVLFDWCGIPRYVGKGTGNRWLEHERKTDPINRLKNDFIERTWVMLDEVPKVKVAEQLGAAEALAMEIALITALGRVDLGTGPLVNMTDGGEGMLNPNEAFRTDAAERFGRVMKDWWNGNDEAKAALAQRNRARAGIPHSPGHNAKIAVSLNGRAVTWGAKIGAAQRGVPETETAKQNMRKPKSAQGRANIAAAVQLRPPRSAAGNAKHSAAMRKRWTDPKYRTKVLLARQATRLRHTTITC